MRLLRRVLLPALALTAFAGTCVTGVRQLAGAGPWTGLITNASDATIADVSLNAAARDAGGASLRYSASVCPTELLPGQHAAFEVRVHPDERLNGELPFAMSVGEVSHGTGPGAAFSVGLHAAETARDGAGRTVTVEVTNNGTASYTDVAVCAVGIDADGAIIAVSSARFIEPDDAFAGKSVLAPERALTIDVPFPYGLPEVVHLYPQGNVEGELAPCCVPPTGPDGWRSVDTGLFSVVLPPGWQYVPAQGIDSFVGSFAGDGVRLSFDYGWYSNSLAFDDDPTYRVHWESIGGREAKIVYPKAGSGQTGIYFPDVGQTNGALDMPTRHNLVGEDLTAEQREIALQIFRSMRFEAP